MNVSKTIQKRIFKDERERLIEDYQSAFSAALESAPKPEALDERRVFYNISRQEFEIKRFSWDLYSDFGIYVYVGEIGIDQSDLTSVVSDLLLDTLFGRFSKRNPLSTFPEFVNNSDVFAEVVLSDRREIAYRHGNGFKYLPNISEKLHQVCSEELWRYAENGSFFEEVPDELIGAGFVVPGWNKELLISVLNSGRGSIDPLQLLKMGSVVGYLISDGDTIDPEVIRVLDQIAAEFVESSIIYDERRTNMLQDSGFRWLFSGTPISKNHLELFSETINICSSFNIKLLGRKDKF